MIKPSVLSLLYLFSKLLQCFAVWKSTQIIIGNRETKKAEVYKVSFNCNGQTCTPNPIQANNLLWSSPVISGISEVKPVYYKGSKAVLASTDYGAKVFECPSGRILFYKEWDQQTGASLNIHSVEVLPDGNVVAACSMQEGKFGILYPDRNSTQNAAATTWNSDAPFGHGVVFERSTNRLFAVGYMTLLVFQYSSGRQGRGQLTLIKKIPLQSYYDEPNKNENAEIEDGAHDLYPVDGEPGKLYLSTGEHVFIFNTKTFTVSRSPAFYTIPSKNSKSKPVAVPDKGGVKSITGDANIGAVFVKASPFFKELGNANYGYFDPFVLWSMPNKRICMNPDYDLSNNCKLSFNVKTSFYKARVFKFSQYSY